MSLSYVIGFFGGDLRQVYMAKEFLRQGYSVATYSLADTIHDKNCIQALTLNELFELANVLIGPIPMSRDQIMITSVNAPSDFTLAHAATLLTPNHTIIGGNLPSTFTDLCKKLNVRYYDFMKDDKIAIQNAIATAEGTIMEAISESTCNLHHSNCLVLGYGRCGKILAQKLKALDAKVTVAARSPEALATAKAYGLNSIYLNDLAVVLPSFSFLFNTIPSMVLNSDLLKAVDKEATIIDIASAPGGVDFDYAKQLGLKAKLSLGLPGKVAPKTSAEILAYETIAYLNRKK